MSPSAPFLVWESGRGLPKLMEHGGTLAPECLFIRKRSLSLREVAGTGLVWGVENKPDPAPDSPQGRQWSGEGGRQAGGLGEDPSSPTPPLTAEDPDWVLGPGLLLGVRSHTSMRDGAPSHPSQARRFGDCVGGRVSLG